MSNKNTGASKHKGGSKHHPENLPKADFGSRLMAWFGDLLVIVVLSTLISFILGPIIGFTASTDSAVLGAVSVTLAILWAGTIFLLQFLYFGYLWSNSGQSLGMKWLHIRVVRQEPDAELSFWRAGFRGSIGYWISGAIFYLGYLWAIWDKESEAWHDKLFGTWVVKTG